MKSYNITNHISHAWLRGASLRRLMALLLLFAFSLPSMTALADSEPWDGVTSVMPEGKGTAAEPYLINNAANFRYIFSKTGLWQGKYFKQTADIDFNNHPISTISDTYGAIGALNASTLNFNGHYDGNGFKIKRLRVEVNKLHTSQRICFGLFGACRNSTLRNMTLENPVIAFTEGFYNDISASGNSGNNSYDIRVGFLAGLVAGPDTRVENIIINGGKIITEFDTDVDVHTIMVGGLVGDVMKDINVSDNMYGSGLRISNIYVNADIDLHHITRPSNVYYGKKAQYYVGGIAGRVRSGGDANIPEHTLFSGKIKAPLAMVSPAVAHARVTAGASTQNQLANTNLLKVMVQGYSGEYYYNSDAGYTFVGSGTSEDVGDDALSAKRFYADYQIYNAVAATPGYETMTPTYPPKGLYGLQTLITNTDTDPGEQQAWSPASTTDMAHLQGVNHATFKDLSTVEGQKEVTAIFNNNTNTLDPDQASLLGWFWNDGTFSFTSRDISLKVETSHIHNFRAYVVNPAPGKQYLIKWQDITDSANPLLIMQEAPHTDGAELYSDCHVDYGVKKIRVSVCDPVTGDILSGLVRDFDVFDLVYDTNLVIDKIPVTRNGNDIVYYRASLIDSSSDELILGGGQQLIDTDPEFAPLRDQKIDYEYAWLWHVSSDPASRKSFEECNIHSFYETQREKEMQKDWIAPWHPERYYRVSLVHLLKDADGNYIYRQRPDGTGDLWITDDNGQPTRIHEYEVLREEVIGPHRIVFVYNETKTKRGNQIILPDGNPVTSFDGIDISSSSDPALRVAFPDGDDRNTGYDPYHAVKTVKRAYELLDPEKGRTDNIIVIMGFSYEKLDKETDIFDKDKTHFYNKPCTITGDRGEIIYDGALAMRSISSEPMGLGAPVGFSDIRWVGYEDPDKATPVENELVLNCNLFDFYVGINVKMAGYKRVPTTGSQGLGLINNTEAPQITIVGGFHSNNKTTFTTPDNNEVPGFTSLTFNSGNFGRVIAGGRNDGDNVQTNTRNIFGSPDNPHRVKVEVSITHPTDGVPKDGDNWGHVSLDYSDRPYTFDIGLLVGGQTDGSIYSETRMLMNDGYVGRFISGNISYGREADDVKKTDDIETSRVGYPNDTYFGSTELTFEGGEIYELYGGSLGRHACTNNSAPDCAAYYYGRSIINIKGGEIHNDIFGAGAGGTSGIGDARYHTDDDRIPYYNSQNKIVYGDWQDIMDAGGLDRVPTFTLADPSEEPLSLLTCHSEINIYSGRIYGDIYGAGYGYSNATPYERATSQSGYLYGSSAVRMIRSLDRASSTPPEVFGSIYGAGKGSRQYYDDAIAAGHPELADKFKSLAVMVGDTEVTLQYGTVWGDVYGAGNGVNGNQFSQMAALIGNSKVTVDGATVNGNIFGGANVSDILQHRDLAADNPAHSGNTSVEILSGFIGNNIFGGSKGDTATNSDGHVYGSTSVKVTGGTYVKTPFVNDADGNILLDADNNPIRRTFNIYGGGYLDCDVYGSTNVYLERSLLYYPETFYGSSEHGTDSQKFLKAFNDIVYRRFCVYGGGYGSMTNVFGRKQYKTDPTAPAARVEINVVAGGGVTQPDGSEILDLVPGQTFFDVAGGGYNGDVGYWTKVDFETDGDGNIVGPIESTRRVIVDMINAGETVKARDYNDYTDGEVSLVINGAPFIRKVIGGGFYSSVEKTHTRLFSGTFKEVYGGALLGYVHKTARLQIGSLIDDRGFNPDEIDINNNHLFILGSVYGGNDVKGIVGTTLWADAGFDPEGDPEVPGNTADPTWGLDDDGLPLFTSDINPTGQDDRGVNLFIFGGNIAGNVYGAGNGHYRGYYVPGWLRYEDGNARHYRTVRSTYPMRDRDGNITNRLVIGGVPQSDDLGRPIYTGQVYRSQPMTGCVKMYIGGNPNSPVNIAGNVYGGGRSCTIGQWNTVLPFEDPRRLSFGGKLHMNLGSYVNVAGNLYLGVSGSEYSKQNVIPSDGTPDAPVHKPGYDPSQESFWKQYPSTEWLDGLGEAAYEHWYFDNELGRYQIGFPRDGEAGGNLGIDAEHMYRAFLKKIEMNADVELTFYHDPFLKKKKLDPATNQPYVDPATGFYAWAHVIDPSGHLVRKNWVPGEIAVSGEKVDDPLWFPQYIYDSSNVTIGSIFVGGECGSMTNNYMMRFDYDKMEAVPADYSTFAPEDDIEEFGSIYRVTIPSGVTVRDKIVGGSENAVVTYYPVNPDGITLDTDAEPHTFEGGIVTQACESFDYLVYLDREIKAGRARGWDSEIPTEQWSGAGVGLGDATPYVMQSPDVAGTAIYRYKYDLDSPFIPNVRYLVNPRYDLSCVRLTDAGGNVITDPVTGKAKVRGFTSPRSLRHALSSAPISTPDEDIENTAVKLTILCNFDPLTGDATYMRDGVETDMDPVHHFYRYGGIVYGGCFQSGLTDGDVIINCASNMLGDVLDISDEVVFGDLSKLKYNIGRVFGGGYGRLSRVDGDTYINLIHNFKGMNVFGGGCRGDVVGKSTINYFGGEKESFVYGSIYGGGLYGSVGEGDPDREASLINLLSGNVDKVYGGSCLGNLYGRSVVQLCERVSLDLDKSYHFDYKRLHDIDPAYEKWAGSRLIVGTVFGGNDITGNIILNSPKRENYPEGAAGDAAWQAAMDAFENSDDKYSTTIQMWEEWSDPTEDLDSNTLRAPASHNTDLVNNVDGEPLEPGDPGSEEEGDQENPGEEFNPGPGKTSPGSDGGYNGFPFVGSIYGGSNGDYGIHVDDSYYGKGSVVQLAVGDRNIIMNLDLGGNSNPGVNPGERPYDAFELPHLDYSRILISGGTAINVYGGGDLSTVNRHTLISINYADDDPAKVGDPMKARAGFDDPADLQRVWNTCHLQSDVQLDEVATTTVNPVTGKPETIFNNHIHHIFGGNNNADMNIQPDWELLRGHVESVYSGGNFGKMTYCEVEEVAPGDIKPLHGISLKIDSRQFHVGSVYGGGRVGDVSPDFASAGVSTKYLNPDGTLDIDPAKGASDFYGVLLEINDGVVDHVYGGNDVSGNVDYGTKVVITGAISGDVYCAGNGNYRYFYDPSLAPGSKIREGFSDELSARYFILPQNPVYGGDSPQLAAQKLLAINSYRPNVDRSWLIIRGRDDRPAYVRGNVYCGGNSSTVFSTTAGSNSNVRFDIGDNVTLNGVFMGSNGKDLIDPDAIYAIERLNGFDLSETNALSATHFNIQATKPSTLTKLTDNQYKMMCLEAQRDLASVLDRRLYPSLLDLYMRAVEVDDVPDGFTLSSDIKNAYIGDFYIGGNSGSMMTDKPIHLTFPDNLVIYGKIVGGSNNASIPYKNVLHTGGLRKALAPGYDEKVHLVVRNKFEPWKLVYPPEGDLFDIRLEGDVEVDPSGNFVFPQSKCMVYGGCFNSGIVRGNIRVDLYSDMLKEYPYDPADVTSIGYHLWKAVEDLKAAKSVDGPQLTGVYSADASGNEITCEKKRLIINGVDFDSYRTFGVVGGGYGSNSVVMGNINVRMLPGQVYPGFDSAVDDAHPSVGMIFGGSEMGSVIGNTYVEIRDGNVLTNSYGGSEARVLYGSTHTIIGWPEYYRVNHTAAYKLHRADDLSVAYRDDWVYIDNNNLDIPPRHAVIDEIWLREGDIITPAVFHQIISIKDTADSTPLDECFTYVDDDTPRNFAARNASDGIAYNNADWNNIYVSIGDKRSRTYRDDGKEDMPLPGESPYYGHGNVYGGGFISAKSTISLAGKYTVRRFSAEANPDLLDITYDPADPSTISPTVGYGGNSMILIWDNKYNADHSVTDAIFPAGHPSAGDYLRDHVSIGTGRYVPVKVERGQDIMGLFRYQQINVKDETPDVKSWRYVHQSPYVIGSALDEHGDPVGDNDPLLGVTFYTMESDGGIYGGGRKVFTEGFRSCDIKCYGYAQGSPQFPKLINTVQRLDLLSVSDCCLYLQGANDFTSNTVDATQYSMTRIGELQMHSSIPATQALNPGKRGGKEQFYNIIHNKNRIRNYVAFFKSVLYVSSITSSESFDNPYRGADGEFFSVADYGPNAALPPGVDPAHFNIYHYKELPAEFSYRQFKQTRLDNYFNLTDREGDEYEPENQNMRTFTKLEYGKRNVGTSPNMIGINNGFTLKVQGAVTDEHNLSTSYYGPAKGLFEIKLLTLAENEGGGYIFALNHHEVPAEGETAAEYCDGYPGPLEATGNFMFPGAAYLTGSGNYNYIDDDCFPAGVGWKHYFDHPTSKTTGMMRREAAIHGDVNKEQDIHYWYVNGTSFFYNVTLTAYTYQSSPDDPMRFSLDANDQLIYLYGVNPGSKFKIKDIHWTASSNPSSDIQNVDPDGEGAPAKDYNLYLSVDNAPSQYHTTVSSDFNYSAYSGNSFVMPIPRANYDGTTTADSFVNLADEAVVPGAPHSGVINNYGARDSEIANADEKARPLMGISLRDPIDNTNMTTPGYYEQHLKQPENVRIEITTDAVNDEGETVTFTYVVNLTIKYLLGPTITGTPVIENGALSGEYIFANSFNVDVDLDDDNMAVTGRNWYLIAPEYEIRGHDSESIIRDILAHMHDPVNPSIAEKLDDSEKFDSDRQIHIPAYLYRNGWHLVYEVVANNQSFYVLPKAEEGKDDEYHENIVVHNYHRMRPYDGTSLNHDGTPKYEDLQLTPGCRLYIEDDDDFEYFFQWLATLQSPQGDANGREPSASGRWTPRGYPIDPVYAEGLEIYLMNNVTMKPHTVDDVKNLRFCGVFHGNGHHIDLGDNPMFLGCNSGIFYNTGFVSSRTGSSDVIVFGDHASYRPGTVALLENCFFYNKKDIGNGYLCDPVNRDNDGTFRNCCRTAHDNNKEDFTTTDPSFVGLIKATLEQYKYGECAYNLNRFYLNKRYTDGFGGAVDDDTRRTLKVVEDLYHDGSYRFASWSPEGRATAIRTKEVPNYRDFRGIRVSISAETYDPNGITGRDASFHNGSDPVDYKRLAVDENDMPLLDADGKPYYLPVLSDFQFFGQDLSTLSREEAFPQNITRSKRVYRASGFYGSRHDRGFHYNVDAQAFQPTLTAVDFTGYRGEQHYADAGYRFAKGMSYDLDHDVQCYYPPMLDFPEDGLESFNTASKLYAEEVAAGTRPDMPDEYITRNLLVYNWADDPVFNDFVYDTKTPESDIFCHIINPIPVDPDAETLHPQIAADKQPRVEVFHLIDRQDFNAPIEFEVTDMAFYQRRPEGRFASHHYVDDDLRYTGWDGIVLPFTAQKVLSELDTDNEKEKQIRSHGELTHFYGPHEGLDKEVYSHEYWLRKFTHFNGGKLYFERPACEHDKASNDQEPERMDPYHYNNPFFSTVYENAQDIETTHARPEYNPDGIGVDYADYPLLNKRFPYIVAWPGEKFYEFDLSGNFYASTHIGTVAIPQRINFIAYGAVSPDEANDANLSLRKKLVIPMTDYNQPIAFTHDGYILKGTFTHHDSESYMCVIDDLGENFVAPSSSKVDPFRVYIKTPSQINDELPITSRGGGDGNVEDEIGEGNNGDGDPAADLEIFVEDNVLVIMSPFEEDMQLPLFDMNGRLVRYLPISDGENKYPEITQGYYLVRNFKFRIM